MEKFKMPKMKEVKENLLNNAKSSIQLGIEDFDLAENDKNRKNLIYS